MQSERRTGSRIQTTEARYLMVTKRLICLANARKRGGRCVAGRELLADGSVGPWIRLVTSRKSHALWTFEYKYADDLEAAVLDIVDVRVLAPRPTNYQTENWLVDDRFKWVKAGTYPLPDLPKLACRPDSLWILGNQSKDCENDKMWISQMNEQDVSDSLRLMRAENLTLRVLEQQLRSGRSKRRVQARFVHAQDPYRLWVTDPQYEYKYKKMDIGEYPLGPCWVTVSLSEPFRKACYKLAAAIIEDVAPAEANRQQDDVAEADPEPTRAAVAGADLDVLDEALATLSRAEGVLHHFAALLRGEKRGVDGSRERVPGDDG